MKRHRADEPYREYQGIAGQDEDHILQGGETEAEKHGAYDPVHDGKVVFHPIDEKADEDKSACFFHQGGLDKSPDQGMVLRDEATEK